MSTSLKIACLKRSLRKKEKISEKKVNTFENSVPPEEVKKKKRPPSEIVNEKEPRTKKEKERIREEKERPKENERLKLAKPRALREGRDKRLVSAPPADGKGQRGVGFTYAELGLDSPSTVDYSLYPRDWCRYCGARFSIRFGSGPWGNTSLCMPHHELYKKKQLKLSKKEYPELSAPINIDQNSELSYFSSFESAREAIQSLQGKRKLPVFISQPKR